MFAKNYKIYKFHTNSCYVLMYDFGSGCEVFPTNRGINECDRCHCRYPAHRGD